LGDVILAVTHQRCGRSPENLAGPGSGEYFPYWMDRPAPRPPEHPCRLCGQAGHDDQVICAGCERTYGPRVARLLARAERDQDFAAACLANFPAPLRERFAALLSKRCFLPGADTRQRPGLRPARPRPDGTRLRTAN